MKILPISRLNAPDHSPFMRLHGSRPFMPVFSERPSTCNVGLTNQVTVTCGPYPSPYRAKAEYKQGKFKKNDTPPLAVFAESH